MWSSSLFFILNIIYKDYPYLFVTSYLICRNLLIIIISELFFTVKSSGTPEFARFQISNVVDVTAQFLSIDLVSSA